MPRYACLFDWTDQTMKTIKGSVERVDGAAEVAKSKYGVSLEHVYWTIGEHDILGIFEAPDGESMAAFLLELGSLGNARSTTMRALDREEMASRSSGGPADSEPGGGHQRGHGDRHPGGYRRRDRARTRATRYHPVPSTTSSIGIAPGSLSA